jgi:amino acid adenylation domain-containing protein/natural product biosynthesis luciferase-like monooxygenase protein
MNDLYEQISGLPAGKVELLKVLFEKEGIAPPPLPIGRSSRERKHAPLSFGQQRIWLLESLEGASGAYNIATHARLKGQVDHSILRKCFDEICHRHEVLRARIELVNGEPVQTIDDGVRVTWTDADFSALPALERDAVLSQEMTSEAGRSFDLGAGGMMRVKLIKLAVDEYALLITLHHIVADGWSVGILMKELAALYSSFAQGRSNSLPAVPIQYADYTVWQRRRIQGEFLERHLTYWRRRLEGAPAALHLPTDRPRPPVQSFRGAALPITLRRKLVSGLRKLAQREEMTLFMVLLAAFQLMLSYWSGQKDVVVATPIAQRNRPELEGLVGLFINMLALRADLSGRPTFRALLKQVKETALGAYAHAELPFEKIVEELQPARDLSRQPICQALFALQNVRRETVTFSGLQLQPLGETVTAAKFDISVYLQESAGGLEGHVEYATDLFDGSTIERFVAQFERVLAAMCANPEEPVSEPRLLNPAEYRQLIDTWNATTTPYPADRCVHDLISEQATSRPHSVAVICEGRQLTYAELDRRSNQLARHLRDLGVGPEVVVGLNVERSLETVVALLAILKSGGAYLPVDPGYPRERLAAVLADARCPVLISESALTSESPGSGIHIVRLDTDWPTIGQQSTAAPASGVHPDNLCYVIFTSGSTGKPKGVMISHRALVNLLSSMAHILRPNTLDTLAAVTALSFDIAALEIYLPLLTGARLVVVPRAATADGHALRDVLQTTRATVVQATPALWQMLRDAGWRGHGQKVLCGGEAIPSSLAAALAAESAAAWNLYGPTETTVWSMASQLLPAGRATIGKPLANTQIYILDDGLHPVPIGVVGELYIGGEGLARGYLDRPAPTAERFGPNPFGDGTRLYRTGDLARRRPDGEVEYVGRVDHQVKIRGFRIELGEIESALQQHCELGQAVVLVKDIEGEKRLAAYVTPKHDADVSPRAPMQFSLFYFAEGELDATRDIYRLYVEGAKAADQLGFAAVWTPERHFTDVAAAYPNPSVLSATLAVLTKRIKLRAGSVVLPLHDPIRVAEEWAVVDNLSGGRTGISFAPGWLADDFILAPDRYETRSALMVDAVAQVRRLWRGEPVVRRNGRGEDTAVKIRPRPIQDAPPLWLTAAGSPRTFETAGALGVNVLTALLNQSISELAENISRYRASLAAHGHDPAQFTVTVMLHAFVAEAEDVAIDVSRGPLRKYLASHAQVRRALMKGGEAGAQFSDLDPDAFIDEILKRYLAQTTLIGSPTSCIPTVQRLHEIGVGEIACLIDFGVETDLALENLKHLRRLSDCANLQLMKTDIWGDLGKRLPSYMIPAEFVVLDRMPLTPNGKVDRKNLEALAPIRKRPRSDARPRTETEVVLAGIWAKLLQVEEIGTNDNFFELGGHSLMAVRLVGQINDSFGVKLPMRELFGAPTIAAAARAIDGLRSQNAEAQPESMPIVPDAASRHQPFPLTPIQHAYWLGRREEFAFGNIAAHSYYEFEVRNLDVRRLEQALRRVIARHDMLRAVFPPSGEQQILATVPEYCIECADLSQAPASTIEAELAGVRARMSHQMLDVSCWPLFEIRVSILPDDLARIHVSFDILIGDAWSFHIFNRDLAHFYRDPATALAPLECSFRDYVLAERATHERPEHLAARKYWEMRSPTLPPAPALPMARGDHAHSKPRFERSSEWLSPDLWQQLQARARGIGVTPAAVLLAAFAEVLAEFSSMSQFTLNLIIFNRQPLHENVNEIIGDFTSMVLLEVDFSEQCSFEARVRRIQKQVWRDLDNRAVSGVEVLRDISRHRGSAVFMPVVFTSMLGVSQMAGEIDEFVGGARLTYNITQTPQVTLDCQIGDRDGGLAIAWDAVAAVFPAGLISTMFEAYRELLRSLAVEPSNWTIDGRQFAPIEQLARRALVNKTDAALPDLLLHDPFLDQAKQHPETVAVISSDRQLTYRELERRSLRIARRLGEIGVRSGELVAVMMERGWEQVVAVLGIVRSGAAYLPVDPHLPFERIQYLFAHGEVSLALTQSRQRGRWRLPAEISPIYVDEEEPAEAQEDFTAPAGSPSDLAYVIYTSGSTGSPKGVAIEHRAALNTILDVNRRCGIGREDRIFALSSLSFDLSVYDIFGSLAAGATIVIPEASLHPAPAQWLRTIIRTGATVWNSVPALLQVLVEEVESSSIRPDTLRLAMLSGDWIPLNLPGRLRAAAADVQVLAMGGATEASIWSNYKWVDAVDPEWASIPYGRPLANQRFHVLNAALRPCPDWVEGELYIAGSGLARGYWRGEEITEASFIIHPRTGERLYRTGDLGRYLPDGEIEFLGRRDLQVKVHGHRIELGEIEAMLAQYPGVRSAVVTAQGEKFQEKRIIAYVVPEGGFDPEDIRLFLSQKLPNYMVPSAYVPLDALPLTPNGKINRKNLPQPDFASSTRQREIVSPRSETERLIAAIWSEVLGHATLGIHDNFFELGGQSLSLLRVRSALGEKLNREIAISTLFEYPTIADLAAHLEEAGSRNEYSRLTLARGEARKQWQAHGQRLAPVTASAVAGPGGPVDTALDRVLARIQASPNWWRHRLAGDALPTIVDPVEREAFAKRRLGLRSPVNGSVALGEAAEFDALAVMVRRQSARHFTHRPISADSLGRLLSCLRSRPHAGAWKYRYASAGGLYPVQLYAAIHDSPESDHRHLVPGTYYYAPDSHSLEMLTPGALFDGSMHLAINQPVFQEAAFSLFLISEQAAVEPMYGQEALRFALLEAGMMAQLLDEAAPQCGFGLCHIGGIDFEPCRAWFGLEKSHVLLHSFLGGGLASDVVEVHRPALRT